MQLKGRLEGLTHQYEQPLKYVLQLGEEKVELNPFIGKKVTLSFEGLIECVHCGRKLKKSFNTGACYPCFKNLPEHDLCIVKPHECHFDKGTCRDEGWAEKYCMIPHYVYLAVSSDIKVGLTRKHNQLKRWGDQGAIQAVPIAEVPNRKLAGELEVCLAEHIPDKTNWRKMLKDEREPVQLLQMRQEILELVPEPFKPYILKEEEIISITYPVSEKVEKIKSYNLDKEAKVEDQLIGIKGQYLLFKDGVMNMRKYTGYHLSLEITS